MSYLIKLISSTQLECVAMMHGGIRKQHGFQKERKRRSDHIFRAIRSTSDRSELFFELE